MGGLLASMAPAEASAEIGRIQHAVIEYISARGWLVYIERFVYYQYKGDWRPSGDRGCPRLRCVRVVQRGVHLEFRVQVGPHQEPEKYTRWVERWKLRGLSLAEPDSLNDFVCWYEARWAWAERPLLAAQGALAASGVGVEE
jgi:hypothetical protein